MTTNDKKAITAKLADFCAAKGGQNKVANILDGVSAATLSQILNGSWALISDEMWRNIAAQVDYDEEGWAVVETRQFRRMYDILEDSRTCSEVYGVIGDAGSGKSIANKHYAATHRNAFLLSCGRYWNCRYFMSKLLQCMGLDAGGMTVAEMVDEAVRAIKRREHPLLIIDEADKLSDDVLYFFIVLYNHLEDRAGIVISATDYLKKRIENGVRNNRRGFREIYSRLGRRFIPLPAVNNADVAAVCLANSISLPEQIDNIADDCEGDMRRVKRRIKTLKKMVKPASSAN